MSGETFQQWRRESRFLNWLRGDYNSLHTKFVRVPSDYIAYFLFRATGRSYTEFYAKRMDKEAAKTRDRAVSQTYLENAEGHLRFLTDHGLKPDSTFLDYGCGIMRTGLKLVRYLEPNKYTGVDISVERLEKGRGLAVESGIPNDSFELQVVNDCDLKELNGRQFDFIWSNDVFSHMPENECQHALNSLRKLIGEDGVIYITFSVLDKQVRSMFKDFWITEAQIIRMGNLAGLDVEIIPNWSDYLPENVVDNVLARMVVSND